MFLIVGHTKNAADKLFNNLNMTYRKVNVHTMDGLFKVLNVSGHVTVHPTEPEDFHDWKSYLNQFYSNFSQSKGGGLIKQNHIFTCNYSLDLIGNNVDINGGGAAVGAGAAGGEVCNERGATCCRLTVEPNRRRRRSVRARG